MNTRLDSELAATQVSNEDSAFDICYARMITIDETLLYRYILPGVDNNCYTPTPADNNGSFDVPVIADNIVKWVTANADTNTSPSSGGIDFHFNYRLPNQLLYYDFSKLPQIDVLGLLAFNNVTGELLWFEGTNFAVPAFTVANNITSFQIISMRNDIAYLLLDGNRYRYQANGNIGNRGDAHKNHKYVDNYELGKYDSAMPRQARIDYPGALHHIICRGIEKKHIFKGDIDKKDFLDRFRKILQESDARCFAWCIMGNHCYILLQTGQTPLPEIMGRLLTGYASSYNRRHHRVGRLFQNRYKSILCDKDQYLLLLIRYIHLNPVRARMIEYKKLSHYKWTGHHELLKRKGETILEKEEVYSYFGQTMQKARNAYLQFVREGYDSHSRISIHLWVSPMISPMISYRFYCNS